MWTWGSTSGGLRNWPWASNSRVSPSALARSSPAGRIAKIVSPSTRMSEASGGRPNVGWTRALRTIRPVVATCLLLGVAPQQCGATPRGESILALKGAADGERRRDDPNPPWHARRRAGLQPAPVRGDPGLRGEDGRRAARRDGGRVVVGPRAVLRDARRRRDRVV